MRLPSQTSLGLAKALEWLLKAQKTPTLVRCAPAQLPLLCGEGASLDLPGL